MKRLRWAKLLIMAIFQRAKDCSLNTRANELTYYLLLALFPFLLILMNVLVFWGVNTPTFSKMIVAIFPTKIANLVVASLKTDGTKSTSIFSLLLTLWAASRAVMALRFSFNAVYRTPIIIGRWGLRVFSFIVMSVLGSLAVLGGIIATLGAHFLKATGAINVVPDWGQPLLAAFDWHFLVVLIWLTILVMYRCLANAKIHWRSAAVASCLTTISWAILVWMFSLYLHYFGTRTLSYGFFGMVIIFLLWMKCGAFLLLSGAVICSECERYWFGKIKMRITPSIVQHTAKKILKRKIQ